MAGPRSGLSLSKLSDRDFLVFGGMTYNKTAGANSSVLILARDLHYFRFYVGGETAAESDLLVKQCHLSNATGGTSGVRNIPGNCSSLALNPSPATSSISPTVLGVSSASVSQASSASAFTCASSSSYNIVVVFSVDSRVSSNVGFRIVNWRDGTTVMTSQDFPSFKDQTNSGSCGQSQMGGGGGGVRTWCEPTMIPNGLYLVQLTSDTGSGWISQKDTSSCCTAGGSVTSCCPRLTLRSSLFT